MINLGLDILRAPNSAKAGTDTRFDEHEVNVSYRQRIFYEIDEPASISPWAL
jgi:hypothetical protein